MCKYFIYFNLHEKFTKIQKHYWIDSDLQGKQVIFIVNKHSFISPLSFPLVQVTHIRALWMGGEWQATFLSSCQFHIKRIVLFRVDFEDDSFDWSFFTIREQPSLKQ